MSSRRACHAFRTRPKKLILVARGETSDPVAALRLRHLRQRSHALDAAVFLAAAGGACTCGTVLALFVTALNAAGTGPALFILFGLAILCTIGALSAFLAEMLIAGQGLRAEVAHHEQRMT